MKVASRPLAGVPTRLADGGRVAHRSTRKRKTSSRFSSTALTSSTVAPASAGHGRERVRERPRILGVEHERVVTVHPGADDDSRVQQVAGELARGGGAHVHPPWAVVHQRADLAEVPRRGEPALRHHEHVRPEPLDLLEHVARHDDAPALVAEPVEEPDHVRSLARVEPGERLVEDDHPWLVDDRLCELDALAHPLGVGRQPSPVVRVELDRRPALHVRPGRDRRAGGAPRTAGRTHAR